jgi:hypothetical protein
VEKKSTLVKFFRREVREYLGEVYYFSIQVPKLCGYVKKYFFTVDYLSRQVPKKLNQVRVLR